MAPSIPTEFEDALQTWPWITQLAGILPLSALVDFIDVPRKLHILQLVGACPLWSWPITPAAARLLLHTDQSLCCLDQFGHSNSLVAMDGRFGDQYFVSNAETVRMCIEAVKPRVIPNDHDNMDMPHRRIQNLDIIHVLPNRSGYQYIKARDHRTVWTALRKYSVAYLMASATGWILFLCLIAMAVLSHCYIALAFFVLMPSCGLIISLIHKGSPSVLPSGQESQYNRMIVVAEHTNSSNWKVFYGQSTILNSLLNRPLEPKGTPLPNPSTKAARLMLRILILGQWCLVLGAAASKNWNAYLISAWIFFCIIVHSHLITPNIAAKMWMKTCAHISLERYQCTFSSRRALINTLVALNPDSFPSSGKESQENTEHFDGDAIQWINNIIRESSSRAIWEKATVAAMQEVVSEYPLTEFSSSVKLFSKHDKLSRKWRDRFPRSEYYWQPFIYEGLYMAGKIRVQANLPGRQVNNAQYP